MGSVSERWIWRRFLTCCRIHSNSTSSEIISTYVYKMGLVSSQYNLSAAIGLFNNIINLVLLLAVNFLSSKMRDDTSLIRQNFEPT